MEIRNEVERDWNSATIIDGLSRGAKYFYVDENGDRHEFYRAANGQIVAKGNVTFNGKKQKYTSQGDIAIASVFKKDIFEKIQRAEGITTLLDKDEKLFEKMNKMAEFIHKNIEEKQKQGMEFSVAWESVTEELAIDIIASKNAVEIPSESNTSQNKFLSDLQKEVYTEPTAFDTQNREESPNTINAPTVPGE